MALIIQRGKEWIRINTHNNTIECSNDGGRSEILACTSKALYSSKDEGHSWHSRCTNSAFGEFMQLASDGQVLLATTSKGLFYSKDGGHSWHRK